jgi:colanic acid/amylovoran biosynthesis protein
MTDGTGPRILLTGTYCSLNRGDAIMQVVCAHGLAARVPNAQIAVHVPFPEIDRSFYARRGLAVVPSTRRRLIRGTLGWGRMTLERGNRERRPSVGPYPPESELKAIAAADLLVDLSGDMLTEDYGAHVAYSHYLPPLQALAAGTPIAICAQSVGPFRRTKRLARRLFDGAELVTLRERRSLENLRELGAKPRRLEVTADLSFALSPAPRETVDAALEREGVDPSRRWIGVSLSGLVEKHRRRHGGSGALAEEVISALRETSAAFDAAVLLVPHVYGPRPEQDDRGVLSTVKKALGSTAHLLASEHEPEVLKGIISRCEIFVGARMHTVMAALSTGVPTLALAYSHKASGIMNDFGMGEWVIDAAEARAAQLGTAMRNLLDRRAELAGHLNERARVARVAAERNLDLLADLVGGKTR